MLEGDTQTKLSQKLKQKTGNFAIFFPLACKLKRGDLVYVYHCILPFEPDKSKYEKAMFNWRLTKARHVITGAMI